MVSSVKKKCIYFKFVLTMRFHITAAFLVEILLPKGESRAAVRSRHGGNKQNRRNRRFLSSESSSKSSQAFSEEVGNAASLSDLQVKSINKMPATLTTRQQCDPSATAHETGMRELVDIGILSCTNDQECVTSQGPALCGVCVPRGRMLLPLTDAEQLCDHDKYGIDPYCSCAGFESSRTVVCQTDCHYETTPFIRGAVAGTYDFELIAEEACYFSPGGELCIAYNLTTSTGAYSTLFSLETVPCSISSPTAWSDPGFFTTSILIVEPLVAPFATVIHLKLLPPCIALQLSTKTSAEMMLWPPTLLAIAPCGARA
jgi:hypothetical protein